MIDSNATAADNAFGLKLFLQLTKSNGNESVFISPLSIALCLKMIYHGANGETQQAMAEALELKDISPDALNAADASLLAELSQPGKGVQLEIANSLWVRCRDTVGAAFLRNSADIYHAMIGALTADPDPINAWISEKSAGKIGPLITNRDIIDAVAVLVNAVYFKGDWTDKFDPARTHLDTFMTASGIEKRGRFMLRSDRFFYHEGDGYQAISLPYGDGRMSMVIALPKETSALAEMETFLSTKNWSSWLARFHYRPGTLQMPRYKMEYMTDLAPTLAKLGMKKTFDSNADLCGIGPDVYLTQVKHKTYLEVNELGTTAIAAIATLCGGIEIPEPEEPFTMRVTHPFLCAIFDNKTGSILFIGSIKDPS